MYENESFEFAALGCKLKTKLDEIMKVYEMKVSSLLPYRFYCWESKLWCTFHFWINIYFRSRSIYLFTKVWMCMMRHDTLPRPPPYRFLRTPTKKLFYFFIYISIDSEWSKTYDFDGKKSRYLEISKCIFSRFRTFCIISPLGRKNLFSCE